jgi:hypothetical protein
LTDVWAPRLTCLSARSEKKRPTFELKGLRDWLANVSKIMLWVASLFLGFALSEMLLLLRQLTAEGASRFTHHRSSDPPTLRASSLVRVGKSVGFRQRLRSEMLSGPRGALRHPNFYQWDPSGSIVLPFNPCGASAV